MIAPCRCGHAHWSAGACVVLAREREYVEAEKPKLRDAAKQVLSGEADGIAFEAYCQAEAHSLREWMTTEYPSVPVRFTWLSWGNAA